MNWLTTEQFYFDGSHIRRVPEDDGFRVKLMEVLPYMYSRLQKNLTEYFRSLDA